MALPLGIGDRAIGNAQAPRTCNVDEAAVAAERHVAAVQRQPAERHSVGILRGEQRRPARQRNARAACADDLRAGGQGQRPAAIESAGKPQRLLRLRGAVDGALQLLRLFAGCMGAHAELRGVEALRAFAVARAPASRPAPAFRAADGGGSGTWALILPVLEIKSG